MNNEKNQELWLEKVHENLTLRGRSEVTFNNYKSVLLNFFNFYDSNVKINKLKEQDIISFLNKEYLMKNKCKSSYNLAICSIRLLYIVCFKIARSGIFFPFSHLLTA